MHVEVEATGDSASPQVLPPGLVLLGGLAGPERHGANRVTPRPAQCGSVPTLVPTLVPTPSPSPFMMTQ